MVVSSVVVVVDVVVPRPVVLGLMVVPSDLVVVDAVVL